MATVYLVDTDGAYLAVGPELLVLSYTAPRGAGRTRPPRKKAAPRVLRIGYPAEVEHTEPPVELDVMAELLAAPAFAPELVEPLPVVIFDGDDVEMMLLLC